MSGRGSHGSVCNFTKFAQNEEKHMLLLLEFDKILSKLEKVSKQRTDAFSIWKFSNYHGHVVHQVTDLTCSVRRQNLFLFFIVNDVIKTVFIVSLL